MKGMLQEDYKNSRTKNGFFYILWLQGYCLPSFFSFFNISEKSYSYTLKSHLLDQLNRNML